jgi:uncharacterized protein (TIGR03435 family)
MNLWPAGLAVCAGVACFAAAQTPPETSLAFELASVKRSRPGNGALNIRYTAGGRLSLTNWPLYWMIAEAYGLNYKSARLTGGPDWSQNEKYDIEAKASEGAVPVGLPLRGRQIAMRQMLQVLLADRFHLEIRHSPKRVPVYELVVSKEGLKLQKTSISGHEPCHCLNGAPKRGLRGEAFEMSDLVSLAEFWTGRPVVDKTRIEGEFDLPQTSGWAEEDHPNPDVLPTFYGLYRQVGLTLQPRRESVDILVISHVERPSEN